MLLQEHFSHTFDMSRAFSLLNAELNNKLLILVHLNHWLCANSSCAFLTPAACHKVCVHKKRASTR